ncbi:MAG TPA: Dabb family protein [Planctomycetota bacterium]|nr:Dabb family protein [Planctomycetota bacterium]
MSSSQLAVLSFVALTLAGCAAGAERGPSAGVLRHVVMFKFKDDASPEQIRVVESEFRALKSRIPGVQALEWGTNVSPEGLNQGFTHCFFVSFADAKARDAYLPHEAHQNFVKILRPVLDKVLVVDYVSKD